MKVERLNYKQLCEKFNESTKTSKARDRQFERWRKEWSIERDDKSYYYLVHPLTFTQKQEANIVNYSNRDLIEPMVYELCNKVDGKYYDSTSLERQEDLGLINNNFRLTLFPLMRNAIASELNVNSNDLASFGKEVFNLNNVTINSVRDTMKKKGFINVEKIFRVQYDSGHPNVDNKMVSIAGDQMQEIDNYRNLITRELTDDRLNTFYSIRDKDLRDQVVAKVNEHFGFKTCFDGERWRLDKESINFVFLKDYSYKMNQIKVNENNQLKISKSKRGDLKNIDGISKNKMIGKTIRNH